MQDLNTSMTVDPTAQLKAMKEVASRVLPQLVLLKDTDRMSPFDVAAELHTFAQLGGIINGEKPFGLYAKPFGEAAELCHGLAIFMDSVSTIGGPAREARDAMIPVVVRELSKVMVSAE